MAFSGVRTKRSNLSAVLQKLHGSGFNSLPCKDDQNAVGSNLDSIFSTATTKASEQSKLEMNGINKTSEFSLQTTSILNSIDGHASIIGNRSPEIKSDCISSIKDDTTSTDDPLLTEINHLPTKDGFTVVVKSGITEILEDFTRVDDDNFTSDKEDLSFIKNDPTSNEVDHNCVKKDVLTADDDDFGVEITEVKSLGYSNSLTENTSKCETGSITSYAATETDVKSENDGPPEKFPYDVDAYPNDESVEDSLSVRLTPPEVGAGSESSEIKLDRDFEIDDRNEVEDEEAKQITNNRKKSRRKQQKTHRVLWTEDSILASPTKEKHSDASSSSLVLNSATGFLASKSETETNPILGNSEAMSDLDLPEGTVFVEPESVDTSPKFLSLESSRPKRIFKGGNLESAILHCTACNKQLGVEGLMDYHRHPMLKVLICRKCYNWYTSGEIEQDVDGSDEQCRWCKQGGDLICCDYCHNSFCKSCIRRNLGRKELGSILESDDTSKWKCYVCDPKSLLALIEHCSGVMEALAKQEKKQQELELRRKRTARPCGSTAGVPVISGTVNSSQAASTASTSLLKHPPSGLHSGQHSSAAAVFNRFSQAKSSSSLTGESLLVSTGSSNKPGAGRTTTAAQANQSSKTTASSTVNTLNRQVTIAGNRSSAAASVTVASPPSSNGPLNIVRYKNVCYKDQLAMVEKLISVTASMQMFLKSLSEDFDRTRVTSSPRDQPVSSASGSVSAATSSPAAISAEAASSKASSLVSLLTSQAGNTPSFPSGSSAPLVKEVRAMSSSEVSVKRNHIASKLVRASNSFLDSFKVIAQLEGGAKTATGFPYRGALHGSNISSTALGSNTGGPGRAVATRKTAGNTTRVVAPKSQVAHTSTTSLQQPGRAVTIRTTTGHTATTTRVIFPKIHAAGTSTTSTPAQKVTGILITSKPSGSKLQMVTSPSALSSLQSASLSPLGRSLPIVDRRVSHPTEVDKTRKKSLPVVASNKNSKDGRLEVLVISDSEEEAEKTATIVLPEIIIHDVVVDGKGNLVATGQPSGSEEASALTKNASSGNLVLADKNSNSISEAGVSCGGSKGERVPRAATTVSKSSKRKNEAADRASPASGVVKKVKVDDDTADQENLKVTSNSDAVKRQNYLLEDSKNKQNDATAQELPPKAALTSFKDFDSERSSNKNDGDASEDDAERKEEEEVKVPKKRGRKRKLEVEASDSRPPSSAAADEAEESAPKKLLVESPGLLRRSNRRVSLPSTTAMQLPPSPRKTPQSHDDTASNDKVFKTEDATGSGKTLKKTNSVSVVVGVKPNKRDRKSLPDSSSPNAATNSRASSLAKLSPKSSEDKNGIATRLRRSASRLASIANGAV